MSLLNNIILVKATKNKIKVIKINVQKGKGSFPPVPVKCTDIIGRIMVELF